MIGMRRMSRHRLAGLAGTAAVVTMLMASPAKAGGFRIEPGMALRIDTGERQNYTTIIITNPDAMPGRLSLDAPINRVIDVPARGSAEIYGAYGTRSVMVTNTGSSRLEIVTRYMETPRLP